MILLSKSDILAGNLFWKEKCVYVNLPNLEQYLNVASWSWIFARELGKDFYWIYEKAFAQKKKREEVAALAGKCPDA